MRERSARQGRDLRRLLRALADGSEHQLVELEDWEGYLLGRRKLAKTPLLRWFLASLRCEWQLAEPPSVLAADMMDAVRDHLSSVRGAWWPVWGHILRVTGYALALGQTRGLDPEAVFLTAIFHDVAKRHESITGRSHEPVGADIAAEALDGLLPPATVRRIHDAIDIHPDRPPLSWSLACVLHDADKLDKVGATGLLRRASAGDDRQEACEGAERMLDDAEALPRMCLAASDTFLAPKLAFTATLEKRLPDACTHLMLED